MFRSYFSIFILNSVLLDPSDALRPESIALGSQSNTNEPEFKSRFDKFTLGRSRIAHLSSKWAILQSIAKVLPPQPTENKTGICYRNTTAQCLINTPVLVN